MHHPWSSYTVIDAAAGFQVKCTTVNPDGRLSLQVHEKRAEQWVVVWGTASVTRDGAEIEVGTSKSIYIPIGAVHRLEICTSEPFNLIEVQWGRYLGKDDIVRLDDAYGRA